MIASISGIRGIPNVDLSLVDVSRFAGRFVETKSGELLLGRDTRKTGPAMARVVAAAALSRGMTVVDYGIVSTPALFRESRTKMKPAMMITASHNEPEFNGLKFIDSGMGIGQGVLDSLLETGKTQQGNFLEGRVKKAERVSYGDDLVARFGEGSCEGVKVALDLGGGAAISHAVSIVRRLGCEVMSINDAYGVFNRKVDPVADDLTLLRKVVKTKRCDIGLGFDCDGDRLLVVDDRGNKRTGDFMLTLAISEMVRETGEKKVVVSVDTTQAIDDVTRKLGGEVLRSKVGEANVVAKMRQSGTRIGGEGSSGGLIDGAFNYCRDSMLAALVILRRLKQSGHSAYEVPSYHQSRTALKIPRGKAARAVKKLAAKYKLADLTDGVKVSFEKSWVLVRPSGTEDLVRVSAEAEAMEESERLVKTFSSKLKELSV